MTVMKFIVFIRERGEIQPHLFVAYYFIMFPRSVSYFHPAMVRLIFIHGMEKLSIIRR